MNVTIKRAVPMVGIGIALTAGFVGWQSAQSRTTELPNISEQSEWEQVEWRFETDQPLALETAERPLVEDDVPAKALQALRHAAGEHKLVSLEQEIRNDRTYYEGEWNTAEGEAEATVTADGVLVETERDVPAQQVPAGVREAAEKLSGGERVNYARRSFIYYEIEYTQKGQDREMLLSPAGEQIATEVSAEAASAPAQVD